MDNGKIQIIGGLYIPISTGGVVLYDYITGLSTAQNLVNQAFEVANTLYIPLHNGVQYFDLAAVQIAYVDTDGGNSLTNLHLFSGTHASAEMQQAKHIWSSGAINQSATTGAPSLSQVNPVRQVHLDTADRLYFKTVWNGAAVINCEKAGEFFRVLVFGYKNSM